MPVNIDYHALIKPWGARLLVKADPPETTIGEAKTINLPDDSIKTQRDTGQILLAGDGVSPALAAYVGYRIVFSRYGGDPACVDGEDDLLLVEEQHVRAVLNPTPRLPKAGQPKIKRPR